MSKHNYNRARNMDVDMWRQRKVSQRTKEYFLARDGLVPPAGSSRYKLEYARQEELFNAERRAMRAEKHRRKDDAPEPGSSDRDRGGEKKANARREREDRREANRAWWEEHQYDTDEELLAHVKRESAGLRHAAKPAEIIGADYIANRFGSWRMTLFLSGARLPENCKLPTQEELDAVRQRMLERALDRSRK